MSTFRYRFTIQPEKAKFAEIASDCEIMYMKMGIALAGWDGAGGPNFGSSEITFNGIDDESGETFIIRRDTAIESCNTYNKAYTLFVRCCLLVCKYHSGKSFEINNFNLKEWEEAGKLVEKHLRISLE